MFSCVHQRNLCITPAPSNLTNTHRRLYVQRHHLANPVVNIVRLNIRSLKNRQHLIELKEIVHRIDYDIFVVSESWLNSTVSNAEVAIEGYKLTRLDRIRKTSGGVCVYIRNSLEVKVLKNLTETSTSGFQQLWIQIQHRKLRSILLFTTVACNLAI